MKQTRRLENKVAIVTGSSRGIGRAIALEFARQGARLVITYNHRANEAETVVQQIISAEGQAFAVQLEICDRSSVRSMFSAAYEHFERIDVLINNAGFLEQKPFMTITDGEWDHTLSINLKGVFICTQEAIPFFERQKSGCVINISSVGGQMGGPKAPHYAAAKAGVISLTKSLARILAPIGVRVNAIAPGFIRTDMYLDIVSRENEFEIESDILLGRAGEPEDVAQAALFLASDASQYITGHVLNVNGGFYL
jgi:3-oxoacyl-[acyl-carrier protein] reductase